MADKNVSDAFRAIAAAHAAGRDFVTVTVVSGPHAGYRYLSAEPAALDGNIAPAMDARAAALAAQIWRARTPVLQEDLFAELHAVAEPLLIFGAGHIGAALANLAQTLGFRVTVLDDRGEFVDAARFMAGVHVQTLTFADPLADIALTPATYVVLVTRAHKYDFDCLRAVLLRPTAPRYIGMIGSKRRVRAAFQALLESGIARERVQTVHAPVGIEIGAETPEEIAVSIAAELIQVRRAQPNTGKGTADRVLERMFPQPAAP